MTDATPREQFCAMLGTGTMRRADAIVVLTGDGTARLATAVQLLRQDAAPVILITGGLGNPPYSQPASYLAGTLMGMGVAPDRIRYDDGPTNTREQAVATVAMAQAEGWRTLILVASPEHQYRAFLTFVQAMTDANAAVRLVNVPASNLRWCDIPPGKTVTRLALLDGEFAKITEYQAAGHCASYQAGLDYLAAWEAT